jgi:hypothetical protein
MFPWEVLITGAVGLAGIGGTLWQGKRSREAQTADLKASLDATTENLRLSIKAEDERARIADKRRIYAAGVSALWELRMAATWFRASRSLSAEERVKAESRLWKARDSAYNAENALFLIAPVGVIKLAREISDTVLKYVQATTDSASPAEDMAEMGKMEGELYEAMRADIGEPAKG